MIKRVIESSGARLPAPLAVAFCSLLAIASAPAQEYPQDLREGPVREPGPMDFARESNSVRRTQPPPRFAFVPDVAPVIGQFAPSRVSSYSYRGVPISPPPVLRDVAGDYFCPIAGTRLATGTLALKLAERLNRYVKARDALAQQLVTRVESLATADTATRERELQAFAAEQRPKIAAIEAEAEALRLALLGSKKDHADWNADRTWHLSDPQLLDPKFSAGWKQAKLRVLQTAPYYQAGLGLVQRGLLREAAAELADAETVRPLVVTEMMSEHGARNPTFSFLPPTTRISLPAKIPPALREELKRFESMKAALKSELVAAIEADPKQKEEQTRRLSALTAKQQPEIEKLEALAEEIRNELVPLRNAEREYGPKVTRQMAMKVKALQNPQPFPTKTFAPPFTPPPVRAQGKEYDAWKKKRDENLDKAKASYREDVVSEAAERRAIADSLQIEIEELAKDIIDPETGKPMDVKELRKEIFRKQELESRYERERTLHLKCAIAAFEPGLSPEQRRLLFNVGESELEGTYFKTLRIPYPGSFPFE